MIIIFDLFKKQQIFVNKKYELKKSSLNDEKWKILSLKTDYQIV